MKEAGITYLKVISVKPGLLLIFLWAASTRELQWRDESIENAADDDFCRNISPPFPSDTSSAFIRDFSISGNSNDAKRHWEVINYC